MTLLSRKKPRTTAQRITPLTLAASVVMLALGAAPTFAQLPSSRTNTPPRYYPPAGSNPQFQPQPGVVPPSSGFRSRSSTQPQTPTPQRPTTGSSFATSDGSGVVPAQASEPIRMPVDLPAPPPPPESRYNTQPPAVHIPPAPINYNAQPEPPRTSTSNKQQGNPTVPEEYIKLPPRESIFMVYNDPELENAIMKRIIQDRINGQERRIEEIKEEIRKMKMNPDVFKPEDIKKVEETIPPLDLEIAKDKQSIKDPAKDTTYRFPPLPVVSPPGVAYQPKTPSYPPHQATLEPGYVVHRKLHFEERNAERVGWDLGPMQTLVSAAYFWRDTFLLPQSVVSGWCRGPWDTNAGKCMPGSTSPYYLYPLGLTASGTAFETITAVGIGFALFP